MEVHHPLEAQPPQQPRHGGQHLPLGRPPSPCLLLPASLSTPPSPLLFPLCCPQAAFEMRERLAAMLGEEATKELFAGTFHMLQRVLHLSL